MNRFSQMIEAIKRNADDKTTDIVETLDVVDSTHVVDANGKDHHFRLPYSSDPQPIEKRWK